MQTSTTSVGYGIPKGSSKRSNVNESQRSSVTAKRVEAGDDRSNVGINIDNEGGCHGTEQHIKRPHERGRDVPSRYVEHFKKIRK